MITAQPKHGDRRSRRFFAMSPTSILMNDRWHTVWREYVEVTEEYSDSFEKWVHKWGEVMVPPIPIPPMTWGEKLIHFFFGWM